MAVPLCNSGTVLILFLKAVVLSASDKGWGKRTALGTRGWQGHGGLKLPTTELFRSVRSEVALFQLLVTIGNQSLTLIHLPWMSCEHSKQRSFQLTVPRVFCSFFGGKGIWYELWLYRWTYLAFHALQALVYVFFAWKTPENNACFAG